MLAIVTIGQRKGSRGTWFDPRDCALGLEVYSLSVLILLQPILLCTLTEIPD